LLRYGSIFGVAALLVALAIIPFTRYSALNIVGVRVQSSLTVIDDKTRLPLQNITVSLQGKEAISDKNGAVVLRGLKLGKTEIMLSKRGYAETKQPITLGWGSNPLGEQSIVATGEQYRFTVRDWRTQKPLLTAEAEAGEDRATADDEGVVVLTIGEDNLAGIEVTLTADGYRDEVLQLSDLDQNQTEVDLVIDRKHAFVSRRTGSYELYTIDLDGQNEKMILGATGQERSQPLIYQHPDQDAIIYVSSRDGERNEDGYTLDGLYYINTRSGNTQKITVSERTLVHGWINEYVIFSEVVAGKSAGNPERTTLSSFNIETFERTDLAKGNYFNDVELFNDTVFYAVSSYAVQPEDALLFSVKPDGSAQQTVVDEQVWSIFRTSYDAIQMSAQGGNWYEQGRRARAIAIERPPSTTSFDYRQSNKTKQVAWVQTRDGKGVLLTRSIQSGKNEEQIQLSLAGLDNVLYWIDENSVVIRKITSSETADYVYTFGDAEPSKLIDVSAPPRNVYGQY